MARYTHGDFVEDGPAIDVLGLVVEYGHGPVLRGVSLSLDGPGSVAITGPSGSGKTTLLYAMAGLERPSSGRVRLLGVDVATASVARVAALRLEHVGFVFQQADLVPELSLEENIELPLELLGRGKRERRRRVKDLVEVLGLGECARRRPNGVSGGQAQRAAIARAVVAGPSVVFADGPTGAVDSVNGQRALSLLLEQVRELGSLLVMVTHDPQVASALDRHVRLVDGQIEGMVDA